MYIHVYTRIYIYVYTFRYKCVYMYIYMYIHVYTCIYMCIHVYTCIYMWVCLKIPLDVISIRVVFLTVCFCVVSVGPIIRMDLCTLMHRKTMKNKAAFDMLFVQIRIKTHHLFLKGARHKRGFMHTNAPYLLRIVQKPPCNFMMRYAH